MNTWVKLGAGFVLIGIASISLSFGGDMVSVSYNELTTDPALTEIQRVLKHIKSFRGIVDGLSNVEVSSFNCQYKILQLQKLYGLSYSDAKLIVQYVVQTGYQFPGVHDIRLASELLTSVQALSSDAGSIETAGAVIQPLNPYTR